MTEVFLILIFIAFLLLTKFVICIAQEIGELNEKLEQQKQFEFDKLSDCENRLYQLEEALELKEYFDKESLNKKGNEINQTKSRDNPI